MKNKVIPDESPVFSDADMSEIEINTFTDLIMDSADRIGCAIIFAAIKMSGDIRAPDSDDLKQDAVRIYRELRNHFWAEELKADRETDH